MPCQSCRTLIAGPACHRCGARYVNQWTTWLAEATMDRELASSASPAWVRGLHIVSAKSHLARAAACVSPLDQLARAERALASAPRCDWCSAPALVSVRHAADVHATGRACRRCEADLITSGRGAALQLVTEWPMRTVHA